MLGKTASHYHFAGFLDIVGINMRSILLYKMVLKFSFGCVLASSYNDFYGRRYDHYHGKYSDSELMVDVLNNFGLRILMAHNENNENNIAFSPYGIGVILIALGEGLRGEALEEIKKTIYLPYDVHTIRVGLRDIHRHLKSYFIPKEGFLAGITLNSENVSINPQYIQILKFYGYDIHSFNTALYPESHITTTEPGLLHGKEETTIINNAVTVSSTVYPETTIDSNGDEEGTPGNSIEIITSTTETISETMETATEGANLMTTTESELSIPTTADSLFETTSRKPTTTEMSLPTIALAESTSQEMSTEIIGKDEIVTTMANTANSQIETVTPESMTSEEPISEILETTTMSTFATTLTSEVAETTSVSSTGTAGVTTENELNEDGSSSADDAQSSIIETRTTESISTTTLVQPSSNYTAGAPKVRSIRSPEEPSNIANEDTSAHEFSENSLGDESRAVYDKKKTKTETSIGKFEINHWRIEINDQITLRNSNHATPPKTPLGAIGTDEKRIPRSVEKYLITRFYQYHNFRPTQPHAPEEPFYFFVNDNNKETDLDFMVYDTVLPFLYIPNTGAMALAFPLDSDKYYLLLVLPSDTNRLHDLICKIYMHNTFKYILNNLELTHVKVNIPSFSLTGRITLTNTLHKLGIRRIFEPRQADFSPLTSAEDVYVTNIEQAVSITIKNNLHIKQETRHGHHYHSEPIRFNGNRPFLYFVIDSELQIILMTGKVVNPLNIRIK